MANPRHDARGAPAPAEGEAAVAALTRWIRSLDTDRIPEPTASPPEPPELERFLVAVDGSKPGEMALHVGLAWAKRFGSGLHAIHVVADYPMPWNQGTGPIPDLQKEAERFGEGVLQKAEQETRASGLPLEVHLEHGDPASTIIERARAAEANLIIVGSHGFGAVNRLLLGSVSGDVHLHATDPVLVVKQEAAAHPHRILVAVDGSESSVIAARWGLELAEAFGAQLTLIHVVEVPAFSVHATTTSNAIRAWIDARTATFPQVRAGGTPVGLRMETGDAAGRVAAIAQEDAADLVCVGARGLTPVMAFLAGSVSRKLTNAAPCSVLILR